MIGPGLPPYVIAELGVNHDGSPERGIELVEAAAAAGADAIKLQFFRAETLMSKAARLAAYQEHAGESDPYAMLERLELSLEEMAPVAYRAHQRGIHAIVTVFSPCLVAEANRLGWDAYKTASPDIINKPLIDALASTDRPLIISTGTSTLDEVSRAAHWVRLHHAAFLQCVSSYPTRDDDASLAGMHAIARATARVVGYSDHTARVETAALAVAAGACILEKHLTHDRAASGPDHAASLEPAPFAEYVQQAKLAHRMLGQARKAPLACEEDVRDVSRQSVVANRGVPRGKMLDSLDLTVKRPGTGIPAYRLEELIGRVAARDIAPDMPIVPEDLA